jgi:replicative DNA helicase
MGGEEMDEELLGRQMPHSVEAEQAVLGSMLIDARCVPEVVEALKAEDFYLRQNREIYETIYGMFNFSATIDPVTVLDQMRQNGVYDENTSRGYLLQLMEITPTAANVKEYIGIVKDKALLRRIAEAAGEVTALIQEGSGQAQAVLEAAEQKIYAIRQGRSAQGLEHISNVILGVFDRLAELAASDSAVPGLSTGLPDLDSAISGLNKSDLILIAARPGMGKTSMALNILLHAGKFSGKAVVFFSLEMSREQLAMRLISNEAFVDNKKLVTGRLNEEDWEKISLAATALNKTNILIDDNPSLSVAEMNAKCRRVDNLGLVVIDYLQLMQSAGGQNRWSGENRQQVVSDISRAMKIMAKELNVPVVCLSQLSRGPESRSDKRPMLSDLRESGAIEQDADIVMFLYRDDYYNEDSENHNLAECIVAKNRHGETRTVELQWLPEYTTFSSLDRRHEEY